MLFGAPGPRTPLAGAILCLLGGAVAGAGAGAGGCVPDPVINVPDFSPTGSTVADAGGDKTGDMASSMARWQAETSSTTALLRGVWVADSALSSAFAVGEGGTILHRGADGKWAMEVSSVSETLYAVVGLSGGEAYAVGGSGLILHRGKDGTWTQEGIDLMLSKPLYGLAIPTAGEIFAAGDGGAIAHFSMGVGWKKETTPSATAELRAIWGSAPGDVYAVGTKNTIWHRDMTGWTADTSMRKDTDNYYAVTGAGGAVYVAGEFGRVLRKNNNQWVAEATVSPMQMDAGGNPTHFYGLYGAAQGDLFAVGLGGAVQHRSAMGWATEKSGTSSDLYAISGGDARSILAVGDKGLVVRRN